MSGWIGDIPFYLVLAFPDGNVGIDLDQLGWHAANAQHMRRPGTWSLVHKESGAAVLRVIVHEGDQPYYTARHVGAIGSGGSNEITAYGIGKKRADGVTERLWALPGGTVCGGEDVEELGITLIRELGPR